MTESSVLDAAGRRRSPATLPGYHAGRPPRNKGMRYPADPPTVEEIVAVMRHAPDDCHGARVRAIIVGLWRAGLRIQEALGLAEQDLDPRRGSLLIRNGKGGHRREVGMDQWGWEQLRPWLSARAELPVGPLFCIIDGPTRGRPWSGAAVRSEFRRLAARAGLRRRFAPHQLRPCVRARARSRGSAAEHHPAPAWPRQSRHNLDLPARDRPRGDHRHRAHAPGADDVRQRRASALIESSARRAGALAALPLRSNEANVRMSRPRRVVVVPSDCLVVLNGGARSPAGGAQVTSGNVLHRCIGRASVYASELRGRGVDQPRSPSAKPTGRGVRASGSGISARMRVPASGGLSMTSVPASAEGIAGATVLRGIEGFGATSRLHTARILRLPEDLPIVIEAADRADRIDAILPKLDAMVAEGQVTVEPIYIIACRAAKARDD